MKRLDRPVLAWLPTDADDAALVAAWRRVTDRADAEATFDHAPDGRPLLTDSETGPVPVSLSHGNGYSVVAFAPSGRVGVDVQDPVSDERARAALKRIATPNQRAEWDALPPNERSRFFLRLWTAKEARFKAGLPDTADVRTVELDDPPGSVLSLAWQP